MFWRIWFWWLGPLCGAALGAVLLYFVGPMIKLKNELPPSAWAAIGAFFGLFLAPYLVTPYLAPLAIGTKFHRER